MTAIALRVNGAAVTAELEPRTHLADFVRDHLHLTGTHTGCEHGVCGACTMLVDDAPARACIVLAAMCDGADIRTIEGLENDPVTTRLRLAFSAEHALQCGYCTPGMLVTARDIVTRLPEADDDTIRLELAGNLCRCTGYNGIVKAIRVVLDERLDLPRSTWSPVPAVRFGRVAETAAPAREAGVAGLNQRLRFAQPGACVWAALHDPALVASCIPGAHLTDATPNAITGLMVVALGPVRARFAGSATLAYDESSRSGVIEGGGQDDAGGTRLTASARFRVVADGEAACLLEVSIEYGLRGALAQLAQRRVVDLIAGEIAAMFARNLSARLEGNAAPTATALHGSHLVLRLARAWAHEIWQRWTAKR